MMMLAGLRVFNDISTVNGCRVRNCIRKGSKLREIGRSES
jgi:hypothetical protein